VVAAAAVGGFALVTAGVADAASGNTVPLTVTPDTGVTAGSVTVSASGLTPNSIGNILECNSDPSQPTVALPSPVSSSVSVSCTAPSYGHLLTVSASGALSGSFTVVQGTVGPPCGISGAVIATCPSTDSTGGSPSADAAKYPCPPTAAQQAAGDVCTLTYGDEANDTAASNILFAGESPPSSTTATTAATSTTAAKSTTTTAARTTATTTAATTATTAPATAASGSTAGTSLASTGPGPNLWLVAVIGFVAIYLGSVVLALVDRPRTVLRRLFRMAPATTPAAAGAPGVFEPAPAMVRAPAGDGGHGNVWTASPDAGRWSAPLTHPATVVATAPSTTSAAPAVRPDPAVRSLYPSAGGPPGLWIEGLDPTGGS
jgi:hypothetical protein